MTESFIEPEVFRPFNDLIALQTTRHGGVSPAPWLSFNFGSATGDDLLNVKRNTERLCTILGIPYRSLVTAGQVHGTTVVHAVEGGHYPSCDALVTATQGLFLGILTADCFPVLLHDPETGACGAAHAGWKGSAGNISGAVLDAMKNFFGSSAASCRAWVGTGIGRERYEVGHEVAGRFDPAYIEPSAPDKFLLDLAAINRDQLIGCGVAPEHIEVSPFCTAVHNRDFFSHRREKGTTGRMLSLIGVRLVRRRP